MFYTQTQAHTCRLQQPAITAHTPVLCCRASGTVSAQQVLSFTWCHVPSPAKVAAAFVQPASSFATHSLASTALLSLSLHSFSLSLSLSLYSRSHTHSSFLVRLRQ